MIASKRKVWRDSFRRKNYTSRPKKREEIGVTVCIAALCNVNGQLGIVAASDRMVSTADIQFEPPQAKIFNLTQSIKILTAGDSAMQAEILQMIVAKGMERVEADPKFYLTVNEAADLYSSCYIAARMKRAEKDVLAPLGLDFTTYINRQKELSDVFIRQIASELYSFNAPHIAAIIAGVDYTGAHIYVAHDDDISCHDKIGFAAIGIGGGHAASQFMFAGYSVQRPLSEAMLLTYVAKKRAEVAPGVGEATDMIWIAQQTQAALPLPPDLLGVLEEVYQTAQSEQRESTKKSEEKFGEYFKTLIEQARAEAAAKAARSGESPTDESEIRGNAKTGKPESGS